MPNDAGRNTGGASESSSAPHHPVQVNINTADESLTSEAVQLPDLQEGDEAPPAYGDLPDQIEFSPPGVQADANITDDGRVNININLKTNRLTELLAPTIRNQVTGDSKTSEAPLPPAYIPPGFAAEPGQPPPPPMNIVIQIVGSRGDVQPFVSLGKVLLTYGHRVRLATHAVFQKFVEDNGLEFFCIGGDPAELMAFMVKHPGLMPGFDAIKSGEITKRRKGISDMLLGCWRSCIEAGDGLGPPPKHHPRDQPLEANDHFAAGGPSEKPFVADAIIANPPSFAHIHIAEKMGIPLHMMFTMPWTPTRAFPHPLANIQSTNTDPVMTNYMSYAMVEMMTWQGLGDVINKFRTKALDLDPMSLIWAPGLLTRLQIPYTYCWSPALIPKPNDWGNNCDISGFYFLNLASSFTPDPDLQAFLDAGPPPVYIGFGSIVVDDPDGLTTKIFEAVRATGVRALVSKGWGGLGADSLGVPESVFMLGNVPHDWLFKHVSAVCHHGGAGTSAAGIQAGRPTIVVPFFGDQPFWGAMVQRAGAGPEPIPYKTLTAEKLTDAINHCMTPEVQGRAKELGAKIREEQGDVEGGKSFHRHLGVNDLRCVLAPSRTAAWRVRRTKVRLSPFAASVLVKKGQLKYTDLKLYRPKEYNTEEQPWDPVSAVTCSLISDLSSLTMSIADFPREIFKSRQRIKDGQKKTTSAAQAEETKEPTPAVENEQRPETGSTTDQAPLQQQDSTQAPSRQSSIFSGGTNTSQTEITRAESLQSGNSSRLAPPDADTQQQQQQQQQRDSPTGESRPPNKKRGSSFSGQIPENMMETTMAAGDSVGKIVETGVKTPMNFCLGLAKGFRNAPRLYNDDTVRPVEKVNDLPSGLKVAGKEFAFGLFDGISGLATQPLRGAEKEGYKGLIKGFGKGVGGLVFKPAAGVWAIPAYAMQGAHASIRNAFASSVENYIVASRVKQGEDDLQASHDEEQDDIMVRWNKIKYDLRKWQALKMKEQKAQERQASSGTATPSSPPEPSSPPQDEVTHNAPPRTGFFRTMNMSFDERKALHARKEAHKKHHVEGRISPRPSAQNSSDQLPLLNVPDDANEDEEFERAIQASVAATSAGNPEEDARIEEAIRASVNTVRSSGQGLPGAQGTGKGMDSKGGDEDLQITDEEYQHLIEQAIQESLTAQANRGDGVGSGSYGRDDDRDDKDYHRVLEESKKQPPPPSYDESYDRDNDENLKRAIEASSKAQEAGDQRSGDGDNEEEMRRAMEASMDEQKLRERREQAAKSEEEIVMEFVKKQSLAEEEYRRQATKGKMRAEDSKNNDDGEDDEDVRKAMVESLKISGGGHGERSGGGTAS